MLLKTALIGCSGFVGTSLLRQTKFTHLYRKNNVHESAGNKFSTVVCAAAPAQKWLANKAPEADLANITHLISHLDRLNTEQFILISTVDVFAKPVAVHEGTPIDLQELHPYGRHRRQLEQFVEQRFPEHLIVRLPGLVGPGLRKNVIYDFLNNNNLSQIDSRGEYQFYPMVNLWPDIEIAMRAGLRHVHLTAEPTSVASIAHKGFGKVFTTQLTAVPPLYDMRTLYAGLYGREGAYYQYLERDSILAVRSYAQTEPK